MKNLLKKLKNYPAILGFFFLALSLNSCSDDDDAVIDEPDEPIAEISADDQLVTQNMIMVEEVTVDRDAWLVVRKVNEDNSFSGFIAEAEFLAEGTHNDIGIELNSDEVTLENGARLILQLHVDDGDEVFEFTDGSGEDEPIKGELGGVISEEIIVTSPSFDVSDQEVIDGTITVENVSTTEPGFIVLHNSGDDGSIMEGDVIGSYYVAPGDYDSVSVTLDEDFVLEPGQTVYARFYMDDPADEEFTYIDDPSTDLPVQFGFDDDPTLTDDFILN